MCVAEQRLWPRCVPWQPSFVRMSIARAMAGRIVVGFAEGLNPYLRQVLAAGAMA
jgi:hypothetical protein